MVTLLVLLIAGRVVPAVSVIVAGDIDDVAAAGIVIDGGERAHQVGGVATVQWCRRIAPGPAPAASSNSSSEEEGDRPLSPHRVPMQPETPKIPLDILPPGLVDRASDGPLAHRLAGMLPCILGVSRSCPPPRELQGAPFAAIPAKRIRATRRSLVALVPLRMTVSRRLDLLLQGIYRCCCAGDHRFNCIRKTRIRQRLSEPVVEAEGDRLAEQVSRRRGDVIGGLEGEACR